MDGPLVFALQLALQCHGPHSTATGNTGKIATTKNPCQSVKRKHREFGNFAKTQGHKQNTGNFLILKSDQGYCDICHNFFLKKLNMSATSVLHMIMKHPKIIKVGTGKICSWTGKT